MISRILIVATLMVPATAFAQSGEALLVSEAIGPPEKFETIATQSGALFSETVRTLTESVRESDPEIATLLDSGTVEVDDLIRLASAYFAADFADLYPEFRKEAALALEEEFDQSELVALSAAISQKQVIQPALHTKFTAFLPKLQQRMSTFGKTRGSNIGRAAADRAFTELLFNRPR
ncbi:MAG: hypothetical protein WA979_02510 [Pacificimonas sp.]